MKIEPVSFDEINEGDYIVRIAKSGQGDLFTQSGFAHTKYELGMHIFANIKREYWMAEDNQTLALQDSENGVRLPHFPEDYENYFRVTH